MSDIEIAGEVRAITWHDPETKRHPKAILFFDGKTEEWVPWSKVSDYSGTFTGDEREFLNITSIFIPQWLAEDKGFV